MTIEKLAQQLQTITAAIQEREDILTEVKKRSGKLIMQSDIGWLLSIFASETGTLMAVTRGIQARKWDDLGQQLEEELLWLRIDRKFKAKELEELAKQSQNYKNHGDTEDTEENKI